MMDVFMILTAEMVPQKNTYIKIYQNLSNGTQYLGISWYVNFCLEIYIYFKIAKPR